MREVIWEEDTGTGELVVERRGREGGEGKEDRLKKWKQTGEVDDRNEYKIAKGAAKIVVARVKADAIEELYANLETSEGQKDIYRIAAARDRAGKDIGQMRTIKRATGDVLMRDEDIRETWGQYFSWLMHEENPRVETEEREPNQGLRAPNNETETERALKGMKSGKAVGSDEIPAEVWMCLGWFGVVTLCKLFNNLSIFSAVHDISRTFEMLTPPPQFPCEPPPPEWGGSTLFFIGFWTVHDISRTFYL